MFQPQDTLVLKNVSTKTKKTQTTFCTEVENRIMKKKIKLLEYLEGFLVFKIFGPIVSFLCNGRYFLTLY